MFRPPNNPYIAEKVFNFRSARMGKLVPSHAGSSFALARQLEAGKGIGVLVDQKFQKGLVTNFFGNPVQTNPLLAKLVRQFDCEVYPAGASACLTIANRLEIEPKIDIPRTASGAVDVQATGQLLNDRWKAGCASTPNSGCGITTAGTSSTALRADSGCKIRFRLSRSLSTWRASCSNCSSDIPGSRVTRKIASAPLPF